MCITSTIRTFFLSVYIPRRWSFQNTYESKSVNFHNKWGVRSAFGSQTLISKTLKPRNTYALAILGFIRWLYECVREDFLTKLVVKWLADYNTLSTQNPLGPAINPSSAKWGQNILTSMTSGADLTGAHLSGRYAANFPGPSEEKGWKGEKWEKYWVCPKRPAQTHFPELSS